MPKKQEKKKAKPAKPVKAEAVAVTEMPSAKDMAVEKMREHLPIKTVDDLWDYGCAKYTSAGVSYIKAGMAFSVLKTDLPHGAFLEELEKRGLERRTVSNMTRVARAFANGNAYSHLAKLGPSKLNALAEVGMTGEEYDQEKDEIDGMPIDEVAGMGVRELRAKLRKENALSKSKDKDIKKAEDEIAALRKKLNPMPDDYIAALKICKEVRFGGTLAVGAIHRIDFDKTTDDRIKREAFLAVQSVAMEAVTIIVGWFRDDNFMHLDMDKGVPMQLISWLKKYEGQLDEYKDADES